MFARTASRSPPERTGGSRPPEQALGRNVDHVRLPDRGDRAQCEGAFCPRKAVGLSAQVEIISREVSRRASGRAADFGGLRGRFDDTGDAERHLVLKLEHFFQRTDWTQV